MSTTLNQTTVVSVETPTAPIPAASALSNRAVKAAAHLMLTQGVLPKGFAAQLRLLGTSEQKAKISEARKTRAETLAQSPEARRIALAEFGRATLNAARVNWRDYGDGRQAMSVTPAKRK